MSVDPLAGGGFPADMAAMIAAELATLAADAQALQGMLTTGDVVSAVVLPSNGLTDLLDIGGLRVAAELPATLVPGETIAVEVTGFSDDRINLQILPNGLPPAREEPVPTIVRAPASAPGRPSAAVPRGSSAPRTPVPGRTNSTQIGSGKPALPGQPARVAGGASGAIPGATTRFAAGPVAAPAAGVRDPRSLSPGSASIEARLASTRAAVSPTTAPAPRAANAPATAPPSPARPVPPPLIVQRPATAAIPPAVIPAPAAPAARLAVPRGPAPYAEPAALLRALQVPVTASTLASARSALAAPERLPAVLETLDRALSGNSDSSVATLRTLAAFVARLEPTSPVLATQVAAFVDQIVTGREAKLVQLLNAHQQAAPDSAAGDDLADSAKAATQPSPSSPPAGLAAERVALREVALDYDLKTQLLTLVSAESGSASGTGAGAKADVLATAVGGALSAITALQLNAAATLAAHPDGVAFALPIALPTGFAQANVRIDRDAPRPGGGAIDGDNFHIAFVLETQHLGTVAIDVVTVGRTVKVGVQTEAEHAREVFGAALTDLTQRLEKLRYRVAKADANVAPRGVVPPLPATPAQSLTPPDSTHLVDLDA